MAKRILVSLGLPEDIAGKVETCRFINKLMTGNTFFPTPIIALTLFLEHIEDVVAAQLNVEAGVPGAIAVRDAALETLILDVNRLADYVQGIANANLTQADAIVTSAGMHIRKTSGGKQEQVYNVSSDETGELTLTIPVLKYPFAVVWEYSTNGTTWTLLKVSNHTICKIKDLTPGEVYYIRYYTVEEESKKSPLSNVVTCRIR